MYVHGVIVLSELNLHSCIIKAPGVEGFMKAVTESCAIAVNAFWQSTARRSGPDRRSAAALDEMKIVKALCDYDPECRRRTIVRAKTADASPVPRTRWKLQQCVLQAGNVMVSFLDVSSQKANCAVAKLMLNAWPEDVIMKHKFRVVVEKFCFSAQAASHMQHMKKSQKYAVVRDVHRYLENTAHNAPPSNHSRFWGPAAFFVSLARFDEAPDVAETVRGCIRSGFAEDEQCVFDEMVCRLVNRYF